MRILFITPRLLYPPNRGDKVRPWNFAKALAQKHKLFLISLIQNEEERQYEAELRHVFQKVETVLLKPWQSYRSMLLRGFSSTPLQVHYFYSPEMQKKVDYFLLDEKVDVVYVFHLRMAHYVTKYVNVYKILDLTDAVSLFLKRRKDYAPFYLKPIFNREQARVLCYEREIVQYFEESWIISTIDRDAIWNRPYPANVSIIPNGVDITYFSPQKPKSHTHNIIFVGYMGAESVDAITYFYKEIFPFVRQRIPEVKFYVIGANPTRQIVELRNDKNVIVTGFVDDLRTYYNDAAVAIAPMRFVAGMQNKILEAMAMEVPVVTTTGGNEGIDAKDGDEIFVADNPTDFANKVIHLLNDWELGRKMGSKARELVKNRFCWDAIVQRMDKIG